MPRFALPNNKMTAEPMFVELDSTWKRFLCCRWLRLKEETMRYVDGYVLPVPKKNLRTYQRIARKAGAIWKEHGALEYRECAGDDLDNKWGVPFPRLLKLKRGEAAVFSWIVFKSRAERDRVNAKVMHDPRIAKMMDPKKPPFDMKRMVYGGFTIMVDA
jgi:uncharacterized protein YbaA (DUF1428 family)